MGFPCLCKQIHFLDDFPSKLIFGFTKTKDMGRIIIIIFFPMTLGEHPLGITGKKRSRGISNFGNAHPL